MHEREHEHLLSTPILPVSDVDEACRFYESLGFGSDRFDDGYAIVHHHGHEVLHVQRLADLDRTANPAAVYLNVDNVDEWHRRWSDAGAPVGEVADQPWGMREFRLVDPWGTTLRVGTNR